MKFDSYPDTRRRDPLPYRKVKVGSTPNGGYRVERVPVAAPAPQPADEGPMCLSCGSRAPRAPDGSIPCGH